MKMYSERDIQIIIELFLAQHFNFDYVTLNQESIEKLKEICEPYATEVGHIQENR